MHFFIAEVDDGFTVLELAVGKNPEDVAAENAGTVVDEGPYITYEDANDALAELEEDTHEADRPA